MSVLFFLPWVTTAEEVQLGSMRLIPYVRGVAPGQVYGINQEVLDAIFGSYAKWKSGRRSWANQTGKPTSSLWWLDGVLTTMPRLSSRLS